MKRISYIIVFIAIVFTSCVDYQTMTGFNIINNSKKVVQVNFYNTDLNMYGFYKDTTVMLIDGSQFKYTDFNKGKNSFSSLPFGASTDSVILIFNDTVKVTYRQPLRFTDNNTRNILSLDSYDGGYVKKNLYEFYYTITKEDYQAALDEN